MESRAKNTGVTLKGPKCVQCLKPILTELATVADGKVYHTYHFQCVLCHKVLKDTYTVHQSQMYCITCHEKIMDNQCVVCKKPIEKNCLEIMNYHYHYECFTCAICKQPFDEGVFYPVGDEVYCLQHHWGARMDLEWKASETPPPPPSPPQKTDNKRQKESTVET